MRKPNHFLIYSGGEHRKIWFKQLFAYWAERKANFSDATFSYNNSNDINNDINHANNTCLKSLIKTTETPVNFSKYNN